MPVFYEWVDFITYPVDGGRIKSAADRLDVTDALLPSSPEWFPSCGKPALITQDFIFRFSDGDWLEAMEIGVAGGVIIWTRERVWITEPINAHELPTCFGERLGYYTRDFWPRNPPPKPE